MFYFQYKLVFAATVSLNVEILLFIFAILNFGEVSQKSHIYLFLLKTDNPLKWEFLTLIKICYNMKYCDCFKDKSGYIELKTFQYLGN